MSAYLRPQRSEGHLRSGENAKRLHDLLFIVRTSGLPWIAWGDWNATPQQMAESGWLHRLQGVALKPDGIEVTCTAGEGRLTDDVIVGVGATRLIKTVEMAKGTHWKSHRGIYTMIDGRPPTLEGWRLRVPAPLPPRAQRPAQADPQSKAARQRAARAARAMAASERADATAQAGGHQGPVEVKGLVPLRVEAARLWRTAWDSRVHHWGAVRSGNGPGALIGWE